LKALLRWAGSKRQLLPKLSSYWHRDFGRYIEPFAGSAALFFHLEPSSAILGDLNSELTRTYSTLEADTDAVLDRLRSLRPTRDEYYRIRHLNPEKLSHPQAAARFIYLNRYCFNGLYRTNLHGEFNVPFGKPNGNMRIDENHIRSAADLLRRALLVHGDFEATLSYAQPGDFIYLDPPYAVTDRRVFREYTRVPFSQKDLERLAKVIDRVDAIGASFVITYADCTEARNLLRRWGSKRVGVRRNIAGFSGSRRIAYELLATNISTGRHTHAD
jgi:DNA adenine methylase